MVPLVKDTPLDGLIVLLVEDYPINVRFAKGLLERLGATVDVAGNGREAVDKLDSTRHRLVLMDIQMPVMDGYEATRQLRARGETLPIIALTADDAPDTAAKIQAAGLTGYLLKPIAPGLLRSLSADYL